MAIDTIFTITKQNMNSLGDERGVLFFRELLWAEANSIGLPKSAINVPGEIYDPDGGVDAEVKGNSHGGGQGIIKNGVNSYQIKTGKSKITQDSEIRKILFKKKKANKLLELKPAVKKCFDEQGTFILVHFGWDGPTNSVKEIICKIKSQLNQYDPQYKKAKIDVFSQNKLIGFFSQYPSLALALNGKETAQFQTHKSWSAETEMKKTFISGSEHESQIHALRGELRENDNPVYVHVVGEPGIGKTRLVLEATKEVDIKPLVIYCDMANTMWGSTLWSEILKNDSNYHAILVVDECDDQTRTRLWNKLQSRSPRIKLITIYNESKEKISGITFIESPQLTREEIKSIIQEYGVPSSHADKWAEWCGNSPRVAHVVGQNLKNNPDEIFKAPSTIDIWDRFIAGGDPKDSEKVHDRKVVLQYLALFKRFGYAQPLSQEAQAIAQIIKEENSQIGWGNFKEIISELKSRKLLQGSHTLYITPKLLHIKLWSDWWNIHGPTFVFNDFVTKLPSQTKLLDWFLEMFEYAQESQAATNLVRQLLGPDGPFKGIQDFAVKRSALFFRALADANPEEALNLLQRTMVGLSKDELLEFEDGRREVIYALEHMVFYKDMFMDAARLLLKLAEAENETWGNNASGIFREVFSPGPGPVAPTSVSPQDRLPVLSEALDSDSPDVRKLALEALDQALKSEHFIRTIGHEYAGLRKGPDGWMPKTYAEMWEGYRRAWQLLRERLPVLGEPERNLAIGIMLRRACGLISRTNLADIVLLTLEEMVAKEYATKKDVLKTLVQAIHYYDKELPKEVHTRLEQLKAQLEGTGFSSQLQRYVGMNLLEDDFNEDGQRKDGKQQQIRELAQQAVENLDVFIPELNWLVTAEAENGIIFGYELGLADTEFHLLEDLLEAQRKTSTNSTPFFLCGYFRALSERNRSRWEQELDKAAQDPNLCTLIPELTWRSGPLTNEAALRVLYVIEKGIVSYENFQMFSYGSVISGISENVLTKWIDFLIEKEEQRAISIALELHEFFYSRKESKHKLPKDRTFRLLTHPTFFTSSTKRRRPMEDYYWSNTGKNFVRQFPEKSLELAEVMLKHFGQDGTIIEDTYGAPIEVLNLIVKRFSYQTWEIIKNYLVYPMDSRAYDMKEWLRGDEHHRRTGGVLELIPIQKLREWVDEKVSKRASYLASMVPDKLFREEGKTCLAYEVLMSYGQKEEVRQALMANFSSESWMGPESSHLERKRDMLLEFKSGEVNPNVCQWIDEYILVLEKRIQRAKIAEEREEF